MDDRLRGTGRTTRMLEEAIKTAKGGKQVFVIGLEKLHAGVLFNAAVDIIKAGGQNWISRLPKMCIQVQGGGSISFCTPGMIGFHWETMNTNINGPDAVFLVDHFAIEAHFEAILRELHRWDQPTSPETSTDSGSMSMVKGGWPVNFEGS